MRGWRAADRNRFRRRGKQRRKRVWGMGWKGVNLGLRDSRERQIWLLRWSLEAPSAENWVEALDAEAIRCILAVGRESKKGIPFICYLSWRARNATKSAPSVGSVVACLKVTLPKGGGSFTLVLPIADPGRSLERESRVEKRKAKRVI